MSRVYLAFLPIVFLVSEQPAKVGRLEHPTIREASGMVKSRRHPGIFWVLNDSGNAPKLFAVRADGSLAREFVVEALNIDWESIANDDAGRLYIGDIGDNDGRLPLRAIHRLAEPDPNQPSFGALKIDRSTYYRLPKADRFDAEALVIDGEKALIVAKRFDGRATDVFELKLEPTTIFAPGVPRRATSLVEFNEPATGADLSRDGKLLAVCSYRVARVYRRARANEWQLIETDRFDELGRRLIEAIAWDGDDLILAGENRDVFRITRKPPAADVSRAGRAGAP